MPVRRLSTPIAILALCLALTPFLLPPAHAGEVSRTFSFEVGKWYELGATDGPVTLHRIRVKEDTGFTKTNIFRPGKANPYATTVVIELEYSNSSSRDWEADIVAHWVDSQGRPIDGYDGEEGLGEDENHEGATMTISTLKYGLEMAKKLVVEIEFNPD